MGWGEGCKKRGFLYSQNAVWRNQDKREKNNDSVKNKDERLTGEPGEIKREGYKETFIGPDGRAIREKHWTDHGNSKKPTNPHEHEILWDVNGNPVFGPPQNY